MLSMITIEKKIASFPPDMQEIALELRNIVAEIAPGATEQIHSRGMSYFYKERGGPVKAGVCQISLFQDHIRLGFIHGAYIDDPKDLLVGGTNIAKRYLEIRSYLSADWEYYKYLIQQHAVFDPSEEETQKKIRMMLPDQ